jgi:type IV pilus assembly protein PilW
MTPLSRPASCQRGMTLVELMVTVGILSMVVVALSTIVLSSNRMQSRTTRRAGMQADARQTLSIMTTELRQAGADPSNPPVGIVGVVLADSTRIRVRADLDGNGLISTTEPSEDVSYSYVDSSDTIRRDPGTGPVNLLAHVTAMRLTYFNAAGAVLTPLPLSAANAGLVKSVQLTLTAEDQDSRPLTLTSRVYLRNR